MRAPILRKTLEINEDDGNYYRAHGPLGQWVEKSKKIKSYLFVLNTVNPGLVTTSIKQ